MTDSLVYNVPVAMVRAYRGRGVIVRSHDPAALVEGLALEDLGRVSYIQISTVRADMRPLSSWGPGIPVDVMVEDPDKDFSLLYGCSPLLDLHPVRVTVPVVGGFSKVVKLAVSLDYAVKLQGAQPSPSVVDELLRVAQSYLHQTTVSRPIEYFHSVFLAFFREEPASLWGIQEEDPSFMRYVTAEGEEILSQRFLGHQRVGEVTGFVHGLKRELGADQGVCCGCAFLEVCSCYFKWPSREYSCDGVKTVLGTLKEAAEQLRKDLASFDAGREKGQP